MFSIIVAVYPSLIAAQQSEDALSSSGSSRLASPSASVTPTVSETPVPTPAPKALKADMDRDGKVSVHDYSVLVSGFGSNLPMADLNSDGVVNILDYIILSNNFGKTD
jgi:hypothetical protein